MRQFILALAGLAFSLPASADIVYFEFTGQVTTILQGAGQSGIETSVNSTTVVPGSLTIGDTFYGKFGYDTELDAVAISADTGIYAPIRTLPATDAYLAFDHSGTAMAANGLTFISVFNYPGSDTVVFTPEGSARSAFSVLMVDPTGQALSNVAIPLDLDLADFPASRIGIYWDDTTLGQYVRIDSSLTSLTRVSVVPEPATWAMLLAGLGVAAAGVRQRKRAA